MEKFCLTSHRNKLSKNTDLAGDWGKRQEVQVGKVEEDGLDLWHPVCSTAGDKCYKEAQWTGQLCKQNL